MLTAAKLPTRIVCVTITATWFKIYTRAHFGEYLFLGLCKDKILGSPTVHRNSLMGCIAAGLLCRGLGLQQVLRPAAAYNL